MTRVLDLPIYNDIREKLAGATNERIKPFSSAAKILAVITLASVPFYIRSSINGHSNKDYSFKGILSSGVNIEYNIENIGSTMVEKIVYTANNSPVSVIDVNEIDKHPNLTDTIEMVRGDNWDVTRRYDGGFSSNLPYVEAMKRFREAQDIFLRAKEELGISKRLDELMQNAG